MGKNTASFAPTAMTHLWALLSRGRAYAPFLPVGLPNPSFHTDALRLATPAFARG